MEGYIPANRIDQFKEPLKEGSVYTLENFLLSDAKMYRSVEHPYRIRFTQRTKMTEILAIPPDFPVYAYNAKPFGVLMTRMNNNAMLSDVVGLVTAVTEITIAPSTQQPKRQVFITGGSERAVVTLWGNHAEAFEAADIKMQSENQPMIILFVGMTVSQFSGLLAFKSTSVTKCTTNQSYRIEDQGMSKQKWEPTDITISTLNSSSPYDRIVCYAGSMQIISCWKKLQTDGAGHECPRCSSTKGEPRYKVVYASVDLDADDGDESAIGHFTFLGQDGVSLIGKDEALLVPQISFPPRNTPSYILDPVGKKYAMTVELSDNSLDSEYLCFQVNTVEEIHSLPAIERCNIPPPLSLDISASGSPSKVATTSSTSPKASSPGKAVVSPAASSLENAIACTPPDEYVADIANKGTAGGGKKRESTPPSKFTTKRRRSAKAAVVKQLSFEENIGSTDVASSKDGSDD